MTWISTGQLDGARRQLRTALDVLHPHVAAGTPIVGLEPSCTAVWRSDAPELLPDDPRVAEVARGVFTLAELLGRTEGWVAPDLSGVEVVAQPHCHHASVLGWRADAALLNSTGATVTTVGGCCGLAGNFGVEKGHYEVSVKVAEHDLLPGRGRAPRRHRAGRRLLLPDPTGRTGRSPGHHPGRAAGPWPGQPRRPGQSTPVQPKGVTGGASSRGGPEIPGGGSHAGGCRGSLLKPGHRS